MREPESLLWWIDLPKGKRKNVLKRYKKKNLERTLTYNKVNSNFTMIEKLYNNLIK